METAKLGELQLPLVAVQEIPDFSDQFEVRVFLIYNNAVHATDVGRSIFERLKADPRAQSIAGKMLRRGTGAAHLELERLAAWWLWRANTVGIERADEDLNNFLSSEEIDTLTVLWVYGVTPGDPLQLTADIQLVPLGQMPPSGDKEEIFKTMRRPNHIPMPVPAAALVKRHKIRRLMNESGDSVEPLDERDLAVQRQLRHAALLLNCLHGVCSIAGYGTSYCPPEVPLGPLGGSGGGLPIYDVLPRAGSRLKPGEQTIFADLLAKFQGLSPKVQERFQRAIQRLAQAKGRLNLSDKALDLGIALEMLLLGSEHKGQEVPGQLRLHFRIRGSWLVGRTVPERHDLFQRLGKIYDLRSQVAHNGLSDELEKMPHNEREIMIDSHMRVAEQIIQRLILNGIPKDWSTLVLGGTNHT
jgi:Apea-like HEPN